MFIEREFPRAFAVNAVGGPGYMTDVKIGDSGFEQRNSRWSQAQGSWAVKFNGKNQAYYDALQDFFHGVRGKANGFRLFWHADFQAVNEFIGTGDETTTAFQLQKTYADTFDVPYIRPIKKPIMASVLDYAGSALTDTVAIKINGTPVAGWTVSPTTGIVTFSTAPHGAAYNIAHSLNGGVADVITWSGQFHWPVRLDVDQLQPQMMTPQDGGIKYTIDNLNLIEVRL